MEKETHHAAASAATHSRAELVWALEGEKRIGFILRGHFEASKTRS